MRSLFALLLAFPLLMSSQAGVVHAQDLGQSEAATLTGGDLTAQQEPDFLPVEEAYQLALEVLDERHIRLYWQIENGYYLYQKRFKFSLETPDGEVEVTPDFPEGVVREDEYFGVSEVYYNFADITLTLGRNVERGTLRVSSQGCADAGLCYPPHRESFELDLVQQTVAAVGQSPARTAGADNESRPGAAPFSMSGLLYMMLLAFVGGSILNLMPCVFPVLSLKVFSFATGSEHTRHLHGWVYAFGVVSSFVLVAVVLITLQQAGAAVGWGFQLQEPRFVALLAYLFFVMGLGLSGLVEIGLDSGQRRRGHFARRDAIEPDQPDVMGHCLPGGLKRFHHAESQRVADRKDAVELGPAFEQRLGRHAALRTAFAARLDRSERGGGAELFGAGDEGIDPLGELALHAGARADADELPAPALDKVFGGEPRACLVIRGHPVEIAERRSPICDRLRGLADLAEIIPRGAIGGGADHDHAFGLPAFDIMAE